MTLLWVASELRAARCPCGCGQWADEAHDPATEGRWIVDTAECFARKALRDYAESEHPAAHVLSGVRLATGDADLAELRYDPARAAQIHAEHMARFQTRTEA